MTIWSILENDRYLQFVCVSPNYHSADLQKSTLVVHIKIVNIYLFPKSTELLFSGPRICQIAIWLITLKRQRKRNLSYSEWLINGKGGHFGHSHFVSHSI